MSIFINKDTRVIVQGGTGREGLFHTKAMVDYGTKVVGAVTPGKGGQVILDRIPVYNTVAEAVKATEANTSCIFVPARFAPEAIGVMLPAQIMNLHFRAIGASARTVGRPLPLRTFSARVLVLHFVKVMKKGHSPERTIGILKPKPVSCSVCPSVLRQDSRGSDVQEKNA